MSAYQLGAAILVGSSGNTPQEQVVARAVRASALDLIEALHAAGVTPVILAGPDLDWLPRDAPVVRDVDSGPFHFGTRLSGLIEHYGLSSILYFGAGSTPRLPRQVVDDLVAGCQVQNERVALTNNLHSSDWVAIACAPAALPIIRRADRDNSLAWMLRESGLIEVRVPDRISTAAGLDIDTPADAAILAQCSDVTPRLAAALSDPLLARIPVRQVIDVAACDGSRIALIGRVSPGAWAALSRSTQCWIRAFSEERGMAASERLRRGEVRSLLLPLYELLGSEGFFRALADVADAAIIDSRVIMAASGHYPSDAERFASDLFLADAIQDEWVKAFTEAAASAPVPVLLGGHNVVAGGLAVLAEIVAAQRNES